MFGIRLFQSSKDHIIVTEREINACREINILTKRKPKMIMRKVAELMGF